MRGSRTSAEAPNATVPLQLRIIGDWLLEAEVHRDASARSLRATFEVAPPEMVTVDSERHDRLPLFNSNAGGWCKGLAPRGLRAQECTARYALDPASLVIRSAPAPDGIRFEQGRDYDADLDWATVGRRAESHIEDNQPVFISCRYATCRLDSVVLDQEGKLSLRRGQPHIATPHPPPLDRQETRLANVWVHGRLARLSPDDLFPLLEHADPEPAIPAPLLSPQLLPKTEEKLATGSPLRILAWGDSVTDAGYLPDPATQRWQAMFVQRLRARFPKAVIDLHTEAWGGRNTATYLAEPPGSLHNYREKVLGAKPDLVVSEFVNDAGLSADQAEANYGRILADFRQLGAEWVILTPHYVRPDWMGLDRERDIDDDPRPYVAFLRQFAPKHGVALADASRRFGRLWRQGIPYTTLMMNNINHPDPRGMAIFADSLLALFP